MTNMISYQGLVRTFPNGSWTIWSDGAIELPDDNWFFTTDEMPDGKILTVNNNGEPVMIDIIQDN